MAGHGTFTWNELMTRDVEAAKRFYAATLGWDFAAWPIPEGGTYWVAKAGGAEVAGLFDISGEALAHLPPHWFAYIEVDDVDARIAAVEVNGGSVIRAPFDIADVGRIAMVRDAAGAAVGWMTPASRS